MSTKPNLYRDQLQGFPAFTSGIHMTQLSDYIMVSLCRLGKNYDIIHSQSWDCLIRAVIIETINMRGYWREPNKHGIPAMSGIYCVYRAFYDVGRDVVVLKQLLYIGQALNANERIAGHEMLPRWSLALQSGETLCYSFGMVMPKDLDVCEAAMIYSNKPLFNIQYKDSYAGEPVRLSLSGQIHLLLPNVSID